MGCLPDLSLHAVALEVKLADLAAIVRFKGVFLLEEVLGLQSALQLGHFFLFRFNTALQVKNGAVQNRLERLPGLGLAQLLL